MKIKNLVIATCLALSPAKAKELTAQDLIDPSFRFESPKWDGTVEQMNLLPKKAKKQALLWALDYMEKIEKRILQSPELINASSTSIKRDAQKAADKYYPDADLLNALWFEFAMMEIGGLGQDITTIFEENTLVEDALAELHQSNRERRQQINTSPDYN